MSDLQFSIGMSKKWDPIQAGHEAASKAVLQLKGEPKFMLIFCTIHYNKEKEGLKKLVRSCRDLIKGGVPSIGGTVTGFICQEGCHTRGVVVVVCGGEKVEVITNYVEGIRRKPYLLGRELGRRIRESTKNSKKKNKLIIDIMAGVTEPTILTYKIVGSLLKKLPRRLMWFLRDVLVTLTIRVLQTGPTMEDTVLKGMNSELGEYYLAGFSTFDNYKVLNNYQFFGDRVLEGSALGMCLALDEDVILCRDVPVSKTGKEFYIKRGGDNFCVDLIDNKPAAYQYFRIMGWPEEYLETHTSRVITKTLYYPLGLEEKGGIYVFPIGLFLGDVIGMHRKVKEDKLELFLTSTKKTMDSLDKNLDKIRGKKTAFTLIFAGFQIIDMMGEKVWIMKERMENTLDNSPYLILFDVGEHSKIPDKDALFTDYGIVMASILEQI